MDNNLCIHSLAFLASSLDYLSRNQFPSLAWHYKLLTDFLWRLSILARKVIKFQSMSSICARVERKHKEQRNDFENWLKDKTKVVLHKQNKKFKEKQEVSCPIRQKIKIKKVSFLVNIYIYAGSLVPNLSMVKNNQVMDKT